ncbi:MAG: RNA polymerase sigma factor [Pirellulales bacterium]
MNRADAPSFVKLLKPIEQQLQLYARRMLRNPAHVEDVLQDAVLKAFQEFGNFSPGTNFKAWMFRFVTYQVFNANRRHEPLLLAEIPEEMGLEEAREQPQADDAVESLLDNDPERLLELLQDPLVQALARLSAAERSCLLLKSIGEFSYHEIHEMLEIPVASVMGYLSRARRRMRTFLSEYAMENRWTDPAEAARPSASPPPSAPPAGEDA